ncbi:hypothetical protein FS837_011726 [Tulasnella sp. UAMH 9824]|nr:hypothetical protein FS837_011726 [Tulasnella sp. UAMH 9824]
MDRLTLGPNGQHWGVRSDADGCYYFADVDDCGSFFGRFYPKIDLIDSYDEVDFVALGADGDWAYAVNGRVEYRGGNLLRNRIQAARRSGKRILVCCVSLLQFNHPHFGLNQSMTMSPLCRNWFISYDDGTFNYTLPEDIAECVWVYCQPHFSLISRPSGTTIPPMLYTGVAIVTAPKASTSLRVLSPESLYGRDEYRKSK